MRRLVPCFGILAACSSDPIHGITAHVNPNAVHDTTGVTFGWHCDSKACVVTPAEGVPPLSGCGVGSKYIFFTEHFVRICASTPVGDSFSADYDWCRPIACATSLECPSFDGAEYQCLEGLCQREGIAMHRYDVEALCLSTHTRSGCSYADAEVKRVETVITNACTTGYPDDTCTVPAECPQP